MEVRLKGLVMIIGATIVVGLPLLARYPGVKKPMAVKEAPEGFAPKVDSTSSGDVCPAMIRIRGGLELGVAAGEVFSMDVYLNQVAPSDTEILLKAFRIDLSGIDSGGVKILPIIEGGGPDEKYWGVQPLDSITIPEGFIGLVNIQVGVLANAKQPPVGATTPFQPLKFPDHLIFVAENKNGIQTQPLKVRKPGA
jgi:hypothetical protein